MCQIMHELSKVVKDIEENHKTKLTDDEVEKLKRLLCSYVCEGQCRRAYHRILH